MNWSVDETVETPCDNTTEGVAVCDALKLIAGQLEENSSEVNLVLGVHKLEEDITELQEDTTKLLEEFKELMEETTRVLEVTTELLVDTSILLETTAQLEETAKLRKGSS